MEDKNNKKNVIYLNRFVAINQQRKKKVLVLGEVAGINPAVVRRPSMRLAVVVRGPSMRNCPLLHYPGGRVEIKNASITTIREK